MIIDTKYNIGDILWGVFTRWKYEDIPCEACLGKGGATIPGTGVFARCQDCDGEGTHGKRQVHEYFAEQNPLRYIDIKIGRGNGCKIEYKYDHYHCGYGPFVSIHESEEAAKASAVAIKEDMERRGREFKATYGSKEG